MNAMLTFVNMYFIGAVQYFPLDGVRTLRQKYLYETKARVAQTISPLKPTSLYLLTSVAIITPSRKHFQSIIERAAAIYGKGEQKIGCK